MAESVNLQEKYMKIVKKEFVEKVKFFLEHKLSERKSWSDIKKHFKIHLYNILKKTKDRDLLEPDQQDELVNTAYNKIYPIIEKKAEQEAKNRPKPTLKNRFLARPSFLTAARKALASTRRSGTRSRPQNGLKLNRSGNAFGMGSLARALNDL
jgi:hypothetical protein